MSPSWAAVKTLVRQRFPQVRQLSTQALADWLARSEGQRPLLLDTRAAAEYAVSHLQGAQLAPSDPEALQNWPGVDRQRPIVVYCSVGYRSSAYGEKLQALGYQNVYNLEGSIFQWVNEGRPVYRADREVQSVHPYDGVWGRLLDRQFHSQDSSHSGWN
ncbi:MAG: rhodanese-like domain-containing protein [Chloroflexaceae bacterium]|nr:rhodanese-like domain-containing protein [Chloroflexaceae bacterium]